VLNLISKLRFERLMKLFGGQPAEGAPLPGKKEPLELQEAVALVEAMICDAIAHCPGDEGQDSAGSNGLSGLNLFGRQVAGVELPSVAESIASGAGIALTGMRSSVFLPGDQLAEGYSQLQSLAYRHVPMVVHATFREGFSAGSSHAGYHGASDLGLFQAMPRSVQQAIDLTVLSRWLAEKSLIPGLIALDRRVFEMAALPSADAIRKFLGSPAEEMGSPNAAQLLLFGGRRPVVPAWFDPDRPVSFGSLQGSNDAASAAVGRYAFFQKYLAGMLQEGMERWGELTGRKLSVVDTYEVEKAELVIVTQGSAFETAEAAARLVQKEKGWNVGVLGVTWLRPFPVEAIQKALARKRGVAVLECTNAALADEGTLMREVRRAASGQDGTWISASFGLHAQPLAVDQVVELIAELKEKKPRPRLWLGIVSGPSQVGDFPKREGLVKAVASDYPELTQNLVGTGNSGKVSAEGMKTVQWIGSSLLEPAEVMKQLGDACSSADAPNLRGFGWYPEPGVLSVRVTVGPSGLPIAEGGMAVDVLLLGRHGLDLIFNPLADLKSGQAIVVESDRPARDLWTLLPDFWRSEIRRKKARLYRVDGAFKDLLAACRELVSGGNPASAEAVSWEDLEEPSDGLDEIPQIVRRISETGSEYDNLPRFWGEVMQPKRGGISDNFPDPLVAVDAVPPYTAVLARPRATALPNIPVLDPGKCTGCGHCWPVCPDSAIGTTLIGLQELLDAASDIHGAEGKIAGAVKRANRSLATRLATALSQSKTRTLNADLLITSFRAVLDKMPVQAGERPAYEEVFKGVAEVIDTLHPVVCDSLYYTPESAAKGSGQVLLLKINPDSCQGCQLCITSCPEKALTPYDRAGSVRTDAREAWKLWERVPDTSGSTIAAVESNLELGPLAARLLSRHASQIQAVGSFGDPGSGERLACRLITASAEALIQKRFTEEAANAADLATKLREMVQGQLAKGLVDADPKAVEEALAGLPRRRVSLGEVTDRLAGLGKAISVDPVKTLRLAQTAHDLEIESWRLKEGVHGLGRSRFGVVVASHRVARWAGRFPNHPYNAPLTVDPSPEGAGLVVGLAEALAIKHVDRIRLFRKAALFIENPSDLPGKLVELDELNWDQLTADEKSTCPPLLVYLDESGLTTQGLGSLSRLLMRDLPIKLVILDSHGVNYAGPDPALWGLGFPNAFVMGGSLGYLRDLVDGFDQAFNFAGPAVIQIHVPIPREHGFEPAATLERGRLAVQARIQPLFTYNPSRGASLGQRLVVTSNPGVTDDWAGLRPTEWAAGEKRFSALMTAPQVGERTVDLSDYLELPADERTAVRPVVKVGDSTFKVSRKLVEMTERRRQVWVILQELAGVRSPFSEQIRAEVEAEAESKLKQRMAALERDHAAQITQAKLEAGAQMMNQLRNRLLVLSGFGNAEEKGN